MTGAAHEAHQPRRIERAVAGLDEWAALRVKRPVAHAFVRAGIGATTLNFAGAAGCIAASVLLSRRHFALAGATFFLASALDAIDGTVARELGTAESFSLGAWLDAYLGTVGETAIYVGAALTATDVDFVQLIVVALVSTFMVSHAKALAGEYGLRADWREAGLVGRGIRIAVVSTGLIMLGALGYSRTIAVGTAVTIVAFNLVVLTYRTRKIVAAGERTDRNRRTSGDLDD